MEEDPRRNSPQHAGANTPQEQDSSRIIPQGYDATRREEASSRRNSPQDRNATQREPVELHRPSAQESDASPAHGEDLRRIPAQELSAGGSGWVTTHVAARALGVAVRTVQSYVQRGMLEANAEGEGVKRTLYISVDSLNALRARRMAEGKIRSSASAERGESAEDPRQSFAEIVENLAERMAQESARAASLETRLELTERTESSLREELREAREENERLRAQLAGRRPWWKRLFGG